MAGTAPGDRGVTGLSPHLNARRSSRSEDTNGGCGSSGPLPLTSRVATSWVIDSRWVTSQRDPGSRPPHHDDVLIFHRTENVSGQTSSVVRLCGGLPARRHLPDALLASHPVSPDPRPRHGR
jgi:hypothetical protein